MKTHHAITIVLTIFTLGLVQNLQASPSACNLTLPSGTIYAPPGTLTGTITVQDSQGYNAVASATLVVETSSGHPIAGMQATSTNATSQTSTSRTFTVSVTGLGTGQYEAVAIGTDTAGQTVTNTAQPITLTENYPPATPTLIPSGKTATNTYYLLGPAITLNVKASDPNGINDLVKSVIHLNGTDYTDTNFPVSHIINPIAAGTYTASVTVYDSVGQSATSVPITLHIKNNLPPQIQLLGMQPTTAAKPAYWLNPGTIQLQAEATPPDADIALYGDMVTEVQFTLENLTTKTSQTIADVYTPAAGTTNRFDANWTPAGLKTGVTYKLQATATDTTGTSTSDQTYFALTNNNPPTISIASPQNGEAFLINKNGSSTLTLRGAVGDDTGVTVVQAAVYPSGNLIPNMPATVDLANPAPTNTIPQETNYTSSWTLTCHPAGIPNGTTNVTISLTAQDQMGATTTTNITLKLVTGEMAREVAPLRSQTATTIYGMNTNGEVVGQSSGIGTSTQPIMWTASGGTYQLTTGANSGSARAVNNLGAIVGQGTSMNGMPEGVYWSPAGTMKELQTLTGGDAFPVGIADNGTIVGYEGNQGEIWQDYAATPATLGIIPNGISADGTVVYGYIAPNSLQNNETPAIQLTGTTSPLQLSTNTGALFGAETTQQNGETVVQAVGYITESGKQYARYWTITLPSNSVPLITVTDPGLGSGSEFLGMLNGNGLGYETEGGEQTAIQNKTAITNTTLLPKNIWNFQTCIAGDGNGKLAGNGTLMGYPRGYVIAPTENATPLPSGSLETGSPAVQAAPGDITLQFLNGKDWLNNQPPKVWLVYNGNYLTGPTNQPQFSFDWQAVPAGKYQIRAVMEDSAGNMTTTPAISITVNAGSGASYQVIPLAPASEFTPLGINNNGYVVGSESNNAAYWNGHMNVLGTFGASKAEINGVNLNNEMALTLITNTVSEGAARWKNYALTQAPALGSSLGNEETAVGIGNNGTIFGTYLSTNNVQLSWMWPEGQNRSSLTGSGGMAKITAVNDGNPATAAGEVMDNNNRQWAGIWNNGTFSRLTDTSGGPAIVKGINLAGDLVGSVGQTQEPAFWNNVNGGYSFQTLQMLPGALDGVINAINDKSPPTLVGTQTTSSQNTVGTIFGNVSSENLNNLLSTNNSEAWKITQGLFVDGDDNIIAEATTPTLGTYVVMLVKEVNYKNNQAPKITTSQAVPTTSINEVKIPFVVTDSGYRSRISEVKFLQYDFASGKTNTLFSTNLITSTTNFTWTATVFPPASGTYAYSLKAWDNLGVASTWPQNAASNPTNGYSIKTTVVDTTPQFNMVEVGTHQSGANSPILVNHTAFPFTSQFMLYVTNMIPLGINDNGDIFGGLQFAYANAQSPTIVFASQAGTNLVAHAGDFVPFMTKNGTIYIIGWPTNTAGYSHPTTMDPISMNDNGTVLGEMTITAGKSPNLNLGATAYRERVYSSSDPLNKQGQPQSSLIAVSFQNGLPPSLTNGSVVTITGLADPSYDVTNGIVTSRVNGFEIEYEGISGNADRGPVADTGGTGMKVNQVPVNLDFTATVGGYTKIIGPVKGYPTDPNAGRAFDGLQINNRGAIAGTGDYGFGANNRNYGVAATTNNEFTLLGDPPGNGTGPEGAAMGINNFNEIAGYYTATEMTNGLPYVDYIPMAWKPLRYNSTANYTPMAPLTGQTIFSPGDQVEGLRINDLGTMLISGVTANYELGVYTQNIDDGTPPTLVTNITLSKNLPNFQVTAINNRNEILATYQQLQGTNYQNIGLIFDGKNRWIISHLATNNVARLVTAFGINNLGQIAASGQNLIGGQPVPYGSAYVLTPPYILQLTSPNVNILTGTRITCYLKTYNYSGSDTPNSTINLRLPEGVTLQNSSITPKQVGTSYIWSGLMIPTGSTNLITLSLALNMTNTSRLIINDAQITANGYTATATPLIRHVEARPTMQVIAPSTNITYYVKDIVPFEAIANSANGPITDFTINVNGTNSYEVATNHIRWQTAFTNAGTEHILLSATDSDGQVVDTNITLKILEPGTIPSGNIKFWITQEDANGDQVNIGSQRDFADPGRMFLRMTASSASSGPLTNLTFVVNNIPTTAMPVTPPSTNASYVLPWWNMESGTYTIYAEAQDNANNRAFSQDITLSIVRSTIAPTNDDVINATPMPIGISSKYTTITNQSNVYATRENGEPDIDNRPTTTSVWYTWTATNSGPTIIKTYNVNFDTVLGVYDSPGGIDPAAPFAHMVGIAANDDTGGGINSLVTFDAVAGTTYYIAVSGYGDNWGTFDLSVSQTEPPVIVLLSPLNGEDIGSSNVVNITAQVTDPDGTIKSVKFYDGSTQLAVAQAASKIHPQLVDGSYTLSGLGLNYIPTGTSKMGDYLGQPWRPGPKINTAGVVAWTQIEPAVGTTNEHYQLTAMAQDAGGQTYAIKPPQPNFTVWRDLLPMNDPTVLNTLDYTNYTTFTNQDGFELPGESPYQETGVKVNPTNDTIAANPDQPSGTIPTEDHSLEDSGYVINGYINNTTSTNIQIFLRAADRAILKIDGTTVADTGGNNITTYVNGWSWWPVNSMAWATYSSGWELGLPWYKNASGGQYAVQAGNGYWAYPWLNGFKSIGGWEYPTEWKGGVNFTNTYAAYINQNPRQSLKLIPIRAMDSLTGTALDYFILLPSAMREYTTEDTLAVGTGHRYGWRSLGIYYTYKYYPAGPNYSGYNDIRQITLSPGIHKITVYYLANNIDYQTVTETSWYGSWRWRRYYKVSGTIWDRQDLMTYMGTGNGKWYPMNKELYDISEESGAAGIDDKNIIAVNNVGTYTNGIANVAADRIAQRIRGLTQTRNFLNTVNSTYMLSMNRNGLGVGWMLETNKQVYPMGVLQSDNQSYQIGTVSNRVAVSISTSGQYALLAAETNGVVSKKQYWVAELPAGAAQWTNAALTAVSLPPGASTMKIYEINNSGQMAGSATIGTLTTPVLWNSATDPTYVDATQAGEALTINNLGDIGGYFGTPEKASAFIRLASKGAVELLNNNMVSTAPIKLAAVTDIADNQRFTGYAQTSDGDQVFKCDLNSSTSQDNIYQAIITSLTPGIHKIWVWAMDNDGATTTTTPITITTQPKPIYEVVALPNNMASSAGLGINELGQVIGYTTGNSTPFAQTDSMLTHEGRIWNVGTAAGDPVTVTNLPTGYYDVAGISGMVFQDGTLMSLITGNFDAAGLQRGFETAYTVTNAGFSFATPTALKYEVTDVNGLGQAAGNQPDSVDGLLEPAIWNGNSWTTLPEAKPGQLTAIPQPFGVAASINAAGTIAGWAWDHDSIHTNQTYKTIAAYWTNSGTNSDVNLVGDNWSGYYWSGIRQINNNNTAAGWMMPQNAFLTPEPAIFYLTPGTNRNTYTLLPTQQYGSGRAKGINSHGETVGYVGSGTSTEIAGNQKYGYDPDGTAALWDNNQLYDLNFLISAETGSTLKLISAEGINDLGEITGMATDKTGGSPFAVALRPLIGIKATASAPFVSDGNQLTYTITVFNHSPESVVGGTISATLPAGTTYVLAPGYISSQGNAVSWQVNKLDAGQSTSVNLTVKITKPYNRSGEYTNVDGYVVATKPTEPGVAQNVVDFNDYNAKFNGIPTLYGQPCETLQTNAAPSLLVTYPQPGQAEVVQNSQENTNLSLTFFFIDPDFDESIKTPGSPVYNPTLVPTVQIKWAKVTGNNIPTNSADVPAILNNALVRGSWTVPYTMFPLEDVTNGIRVYDNTPRAGRPARFKGVTINNVLLSQDGTTFVTNEATAGIYVLGITAKDNFGASAPPVYTEVVVDTEPTVSTINQNPDGSLTGITPKPTLLYDGIATYLADQTINITGTAWPATQIDGGGGRESDPVLAKLDGISAMALDWQKCMVVINANYFNGNFGLISNNFAADWTAETNTDATLMPGTNGETMKLNPTVVEQGTQSGSGGATSGWIYNVAPLRAQKQDMAVITAWTTTPGTKLNVDFGGGNIQTVTITNTTPNYYLINGTSGNGDFGLEATTGTNGENGSVMVEAAELYEMEQANYQTMNLQPMSDPTLGANGNLNWQPGPGTYFINLEAFDNFGASAKAPGGLIRFTQPPTASITQPNSSRIIGIPSDGVGSAQTIEYNGLTTDPDAYIQRMELLDNGLALITNNSLVKTNISFNYILNLIPGTNYNLVARAWNNQGVYGDSKPVRLKLDYEPDGYLLNPTNGYIDVPPSGAAAEPIQFQLYTLDRDGYVTNVTYILNGSPFATVNTEGSVDKPTIVTASTVIDPKTPIKTYTFQAELWDNDGISKLTTNETFEINHEPSVEILSPTNGTTNLSLVDIPITIKADDEDTNMGDYVAKVSFYANGIQVGNSLTFDKEQTSDKYKFTWPDVKAGAYTLTAIAEDTHGATRTSKPVKIIVNTPPTLAWISPTNNSTVYGNRSLNLEVYAADVDHNINRITFSAYNPLTGTIPIGSENPLDEMTTWTNVEPGRYVITARVIDDLGGQTNTSITANIGPAQEYHILPGNMIEPTELNAINNNDKAVGTSYTATNESSAIWDGIPETATGIKNNSGLIGISDNNVLVGNWYDTNHFTPFTYYKGANNLLPFDLASGASNGIALHESSKNIWAVGYVMAKGQPWAAQWNLQTESGTIVNGLGAGSEATWVNDNGDMVGAASTNGIPYPITEINGRLTKWPQYTGKALGMDSRHDLLISEATSIQPGSGATKAALLHNGVLVDITNDWGNALMKMQSINDNGFVVGQTMITSNKTACLWVNGAAFPLNQLVNNGGGWNILNANYINNNGRILATGVKNGVTNAIVIMPPTWSNIPPVISWVEPTASQNYTPGTPIKLTVNARDPDGFIKRVDFTVGTNFIGSATSGNKLNQWSIDYPGTLPIGAYQAKAVAYDKYNAATEAPVQRFTVDDPPTFQFMPLTKTVAGRPLQEANGYLIVQQGENLALKSTATDPDAGNAIGGSVSRAYYNRPDYGFTVSAPYTATDPYGTTVSAYNKPGYWTLTGYTMDDLGVHSSTNSPAAQLKIRINALPNITVSTPYQNAAYPYPSAIQISASAADPDGDGIATMSLTVDSNTTPTLVVHASTLSYNFASGTLAAGPHTFTITAIDGVGGTRIVKRTIMLNNAPIVQIISPVQTTTGISENDPLIVQAYAYDPPNGSVAGDPSLQVSATVWNLDQNNARGSCVLPYSNNPADGKKTYNNKTGAYILHGGGHYEIVVAARDNYGAITTATNFFYVNKIPVINLIKPQLPAYVQVPNDTVNMAFTVIDPDGAIGSWNTVYIKTPDGSSIPATQASDKTNYTFTSTQTLTPGTNSDFVISVTDSSGGTSTLTVPVYANVVPTTTAPTAEITGEPSSTNTLFYVSPGTNLNLTLRCFAANADTGTKDITKVNFYAGTNLVGTTTRGETSTNWAGTRYSAIWTNVPPGQWNLTAKATDRQEGTTVNPPNTQIQVKGASGVYIVNPTAGHTFLPGDSLTGEIRIAPDAGTTFASGNMNIYFGTPSTGTRVLTTQINSTDYTFNEGSIDLGVVKPGEYTLEADVDLQDTNGAVAPLPPVTRTFWIDSPPALSLNAPKIVHTPTAPVQISYTASDTDPLPIARIQLLAGTTMLDSETFTSPQNQFDKTVEWTPAITAGTVNMELVAYDTAGVKSTITKTIVVNAKPKIAFLEPGTGPTNVVPTQNSLNIDIKAYSPDDNVTNLIVNMDGSVIGTATGSTTYLEYKHLNPAPTFGHHKITAVAMDNQGGVETNTLYLIASSAPAVTLTSPPNGLTVEANASVLLGANAIDVNGSIANVQFYVNNVDIGAGVGVNPYTHGWSSATGGTFNIYAVATDTLGLSTTSSVAQVTVNEPPVVSLTSPANGAVEQYPSTVTITATAGVTTGGSITRVDYYVDNQLITGNTNLTGPTWSDTVNLSPGRHTIYAKATDSNGGSATSSARSITINQKPTATITYPTNQTSVALTNKLNILIQTADPNSNIGDHAAGVNLYEINGQLLGSATPVTGVPGEFEYQWLNPGSGARTIYPQVWDTLGGTNDYSNSPSTFNLTPVPGITFLNMNSGEILDSRQPVTAKLLAQTPNGTIASLTLDVNGTLESGWTNGMFINGNTGNGNCETTLGNGQPAVWALMGTGGLEPTITTSKQLVYDGNTSIILPASSTDETGISRQSIITPNATYELVVNARSLGTNNGSITLAIGSKTWNLNITPQYQTFKVSQTVPAGATNLAIAIESAKGTEGCVVDDITLTSVPSQAGGPDTYSTTWTWGSKFPVKRITTITATAIDNTGYRATTTLTVTNDLPPQIAVTTPKPNTNGVILNQGLTADLTCTTTDQDGTVSAVQYWIGTTNFAGLQMVAQTTNTPDFAATWTGKYGRFGLSAVAIDNDGIATTNHYELIMNAAPSVTLLSPINNEVIPVSGGTNNLVPPFILKAQATQPDSDGLAKIRFWEKAGTNQAVMIGSTTNLTNGIGTVSWAPTTTGPIVLTAEAIDNNGGHGTSAPPVLVTLNIKPVVVLTSPAVTDGKAVVQAGNSLNLSAFASDANDSVVKVQYFLSNGVTTNLLGTATTSPYTVTDSNPAAGNYTLWAVATDTYGSTGTTPPITVDVHEAPKNVTLVTPKNNGIYQMPDPITMTATVQLAPDVNGGTAHFMVDGKDVVDSTVGTQTGTPGEYKFQALWNQPTRGGHRVSVEFTDNLGGQATSADSAILVNARPQVTVSDELITNQPTSTETLTPGLDIIPIPPDQNSRLDANMAQFDLRFKGTDADSVDGDYVTYMAVSKTEQGTNEILSAGSYNSQETPLVQTNLGALTHRKFELTTIADDTRNGWITNHYQVVATYLPTISTWDRTPGDPRVNAGTTVTFNLTCRDVDSGLSRVELYQQQGGAWTLLRSIGTNEMTAPYTNQQTFHFPWIAETSGSHSFMAKVYDQDGAVVQTTAQILSVNTAPTVSWITPTNQEVLLTGKPITMQANVSDDLSTPRNGLSVAFYSSATGTNPISGYVSETEGSQGYIYSLNWTPPNQQQTLSVVASDGSLSTTNTINVVVDTPPTAVINAPANGEVLVQHTGTSIQYQIGDADPQDQGNLQFSLNVDGTNIAKGHGISGSYTQPWNTGNAGQHQIVLKVTDTRGISTSTTNQIISSSLPNITWVGEPANIEAKASQTVPLNVAANANSGINQVMIEETNPAATTLGQANITTKSDPATGNPIYTFNWIPQTTGTHWGNVTLLAVATDNNGLTSESFPLHCTIDTPPTVKEWGVTNNTKVLQGTTWTITGSAGDADSAWGDAIAKFEIDINGNVAFTSTPQTGSYQKNVQWTPTESAGAAVTIQTIATDRMGISTTNSITVTVAAKPQISWDNPAAGSAISETEGTELETTAMDPDGYVTQVAYYASLNGGRSNLLDVVNNPGTTDKSTPYSYKFLPKSVGNYTLTAVATDNDGYRTAETRTVSILALPSAQILEPIGGDTNRYMTSLNGIQVHIRALGVSTSGTVKKMWITSSDINQPGQVATTNANTLNTIITLPAKPTRNTTYHLKIWTVDNNNQTNTTGLDINAQYRIDSDMNGDGINDWIFTQPTADTNRTIVDFVPRSSSNLQTSSGGTQVEFNNNGNTLVAVADFNRDGYADLLWMGPGGTLYVTYLQGTKVLNTTQLNGATVPAGYSVVGCGDIKGTGLPGIVIADAQNVSYMQTESTNKVLAAKFLFGKVSTLQPIGLGDVNNDGKLDVIMALGPDSGGNYTLLVKTCPVPWNSSLGWQFAYIFNGETSSTPASFTSPQTGVGIMDINGDWTGDVILEKTGTSPTFQGWTLKWNRQLNRVYVNQELGLLNGIDLSGWNYAGPR